MKTFQTPGKEKWANSIGMALMHFGEIEMVTYFCLDEFPSEKIFDSTCHLRLSARIDLIIDVIKSKFREEDGRKMIELFKEAKKLAQKRNFLAHNPMKYEVFEDEQGKIADFQEVLKSGKDLDKHITYTELVDIEKRAESLSVEIWNEFRKLSDLHIQGKYA